MAKTWRYKIFVLVVAISSFLWSPFQAPSTAQAQRNPAFRVYFTFEDGPTSTYTPQILDILAAFHAHATFLIAGHQIAGHEAIIQRELREGHALVDHLWSEPGYYAGAPDDKVQTAYLRTEDAIRAAAGPELAVYDRQTKMFWQPGGGVKPFPPLPGVQVITYNWEVDSDDCGWNMPNVDLQTGAFDTAVIDNVLNVPQSDGAIYNAYDYGDGVIVAMHDINRVTGRVLPIIMRELQQAGATFESLPRPWDQIGTMPVVIGTPPSNTSGVAGAVFSGHTLDVVHIRQKPSLNASIVDSLPANVALEVSGRTNQRADPWLYVQYGGKAGWVSRSLVKAYGPIPNLTNFG